VRIKQPGFVPTFALRFTLGYYLTERIAAAVSVRFQPSSGQGDLANLLIGARGQFLVTEPAAQGLNAAIHLGTSVGQIQPQPPQAGASGPFVISGLNGIQAGGTIGYRFSNNAGLFVTPELNILLPTFLLDIDLSAGLELAF
jgi:hypothetical protein